MSSTNRGYDRHKSDYYVTPKQDVKEFLKHFTQIENISNDLLQDLKWLDPCCGGDIRNDATYLNLIKELYAPSNIIGIDIRQDSKADIKENYLTRNNNLLNADIIISNPPFYLAEEFIKKSLEIVNNKGYVIMLLRLNFFGSKKRKPIFEKTMPNSCYVHHKRISFMNGATDSIEYAHFVWKKGVNNDHCKTYVI
jgi:hypothetical protein